MMTAFPNKQAVGARIKQIRNLRGMAQCKLAERLDYIGERQQ